MTDVFETIRQRRKEEASTLREEVRRLDREIAVLDTQVTELEMAIGSLKGAITAHSDRRTMAKDMLREIGEAISPDYNPYEGNFSEWKDVVREFSIGDLDQQKEPDEVYYACYETPSYEGYAHVFFRRGRTYYWASGSHCSCMGLEDQWEPVSYEDKQLFIDCLKRHYSSKDWEEKVIARLS